MFRVAKDCVSWEFSSLCWLIEIYRKKCANFPLTSAWSANFCFEVSPLGALLFGVSDHGLAVFMMKSAALLCGFNPHCHPRTVHAGTF
jgi:hypothetical protein